MGAGIRTVIRIGGEHGGVRTGVETKKLIGIGVGMRMG